ncbi:MAG: hypothetical protein QW625_03170 [Candidatus Nanoarchaeia archaeon]
MPCPKFIDNTRECIKEIDFVPLNTFKFCTTNKYKKCPFYLILSGNKDICENIRKCPFFRRFTLYDFDKFVEISNKYCTSKNHIKCKRYILKKQGKEVPENLHPDGHFVND